MLQRIALRKKAPALQSETIEFFQDLENQVVAYVRCSDRDSQVVIIANFSDRTLMHYQVPHFPANRTWHEWTKNYDIESSEQPLTVNL